MLNDGTFEIVEQAEILLTPATSTDLHTPARSCQQARHQVAQLVIQAGLTKDKSAAESVAWATNSAALWLTRKLRPCSKSLRSHGDNRSRSRNLCKSPRVSRESSICAHIVAVFVQVNSHPAEIVAGRDTRRRPF